MLLVQAASLQPIAVQSETARQHSPLLQHIPPSQYPELQVAAPAGQGAPFGRCGLHVPASQKNPVRQSVDALHCVRQLTASRHFRLPGHAVLVPELLQLPLPSQVFAGKSSKSTH